MATSEEFLKALQTHLGLEVIDVSDEPTSLRGIFRKTDASETWKEAFKRLLFAEPSATWSVDLSKKYFLLGDKLVFGWRILVTSPDLKADYDELIRLLIPPRSYEERDEVPIIGQNGPRNMETTRGKGIMPAGTVPAILRRGN